MENNHRNEKSPFSNGKPLLSRDLAGNSCQFRSHKHDLLSGEGTRSSHQLGRQTAFSSDSWPSALVTQPEPRQRFGVGKLLMVLGSIHLRQRNAVRLTGGNRSRLFFSTRWGFSLAHFPSLREIADLPLQTQSFYRGPVMEYVNYQVPFHCRSLFSVLMCGETESCTPGDLLEMTSCTHLGLN